MGIGVQAGNDLRRATAGFKMHKNCKLFYIVRISCDSKKNYKKSFNPAAILSKTLRVGIQERSLSEKV
jgi:hypothetical protein